MWRTDSGWFLRSDLPVTLVVGQDAPTKAPSPYAELESRNLGPAILRFSLRSYEIQGLMADGLEDDLALNRPSGPRQIRSKEFGFVEG